MAETSQMTATTMGTSGLAGSGLAPQIASDLKKNPSDEWALAMDEYQSDKDSDSADRRRGIRDVLAFCGLDTDQWPENETNDLDMDGRYPKSYNLCQYYVNGVSGNLVMNWVDPKFVDREDDDPSTINRIKKLQQIYFSDKEWGKYKNSAVKTVHNGCIYRGVEEIIIDRTKEPLGRIRFVPLKSDMVIFDPSNQTDDISRNAKRAHKQFYLSPEEMLLYYPRMEKEIQEALKKAKKVDDDMGERSEPTKAAGPLDVKQMMGNKYLCIETQKIVMEKQKVVIDTLSGLTLPKTGFPSGSTEDFMAKQAWAQAKGVDIDPENLWIEQRLIPVNYIKTFVPSLAVVLEDRKDERQLQGHLPLYCWSLIMKGGKTLGVVDLALEAQRSINRREMAKDKTTDQTPWLGKWWYRKDMFEDASEDDEAKFVNTFNDASRPVAVPSAVPLGGESKQFGQVSGTQMPSGLFQDEQWKLTLLNLICYLPPVLQGSGGGSSESGVLFGRKVIEANVVQQMPAKNLEQHENYKAEDWVITAIGLYGGRTQAEKIANLNRQFKGEDGKSFTINTLTGVDENGEIVIDDDISKLNRVEVIISQAKENDYLKQAKREINIAAVQAMGPSNPGNDMIHAAFEVALAKSMDQSDEVEKKNVEAACKLRLDLAMANGQAALQKVLQQINPPQQPPQGQSPPPPGGNGAPAAPPPGPQGAPQHSAPQQPPAAAPHLQQKPPPPASINPETVKGQTAVSPAARPV